MNAHNPKNDPQAGDRLSKRRTPSSDPMVRIVTKRKGHGVYYLDHRGKARTCWITSWRAWAHKAQVEWTGLAPDEAVMLPSDITPPELRAELEAAGVKFGNPDGLFVPAQLPAGWTVRQTWRRAMRELVDPCGKVRALLYVEVYTIAPGAQEVSHA